MFSWRWIFYINLPFGIAGVALTMAIIPNHRSGEHGSFDTKGLLLLAFAIGAGSQMLQPLAIAVIGGVLVSMILSLVITPAVHFYLGGRNGPANGPQTPSVE